MIENFMAMLYELAHTGNGALIPVLCLAGAYLLGAVSPSILLGRLYGVDIRDKGSGNAGTTNALRVLGKKVAALTLAIDILKGCAAVLLARMVLGDAFALLCGLAALCGHIWPIFFQFKGGKGVATALGAVMAFDIRIGLALAGLALLLIFVTKRVSVGALAAAAALPIAIQMVYPAYFAIAALIAVLVWVKHRQNIGRLLKGQEPKLKFKAQ
ncbi:MAG: glycerol-3-phosphate 1-O-acyltransferase PlsY [Clostridiales Family XIII bacterium]|jgi:glycerol-3-phosphate acyltransferase PlsY|nr:glycerol-3-phosphate 1-O-acyltransferase PlsY [Clostridiales Family XIII bacterium]